MHKRILALAAILALFASATAVPAAAQAANSLKAVSFQKTDKGIDVMVRVEGEFLSQVQGLSNPTRIAIDLSPLSRIEAQPYIEVGQAGLISIRTGQYSPLIARVVLDFSGALPGYEIAKTETGLVIRISTTAKPAVVAPPVREQMDQEQRIQQRNAAEATEATAGTRGGREGFANTMIGVGFGSYQIPDIDFKEIYGQDAPTILGLSLSRTLVQFGSLALDAEGGIRFYSKAGSATLTGEAATFKMTPKSLSGRLNYQWKYFQVFIGYGLDWYSYTETSTIANTTGNANGHHFTAGMYLIPPVLDGKLRVKLYYKFTTVTALSNDISVELGGNEYGVGLSFGFNVFRKGILSF
jgi:hypothetical protein